MTQKVKKRDSKKTKTSWRKIEHKDVDSFLEDQRLEERIGKVSEKTNDELFAIDTTPIKQEKKKKKSSLTRLEKRKQLLKRTPKCFASLENDSKVPDSIVKRNRVRTKEERKHFIAKSIELANAKKGIVKKKLLTSVADRAKAYQKAEEKRRANKKFVFDTDIWESGTPKDQRKDFKSPWLDSHVTDHNIANTGTPVVSVPSSAFHKRSKLSAISAPHPGMSYNPTLKDHQDLLAAAEEREKKIIKQELHLDRVTTAMFNKVSAVERDIAQLKELNSGLDDDDDVKNESDSADDNELKSINPPVVVKKKDKKARRKQKEQREIKQQLLQKKLEKKKITDIHRLKFINEEIRTMEQKLKEFRERKLKRETEKRFQPGRLGKTPFEEEEIDFNMPEEISGNLRNIVPEGNILKDRFKSLQRRNIVAPSKDMGLRRRREIKRFVRNTHKEIPEQPNKSKKKK